MEIRGPFFGPSYLHPKGGYAFSKSVSLEKGVKT